MMTVRRIFLEVAIMTESWSNKATVDPLLDAAMIRVAPKADGRGVQFSNRVQAICLPTTTCTATPLLHYVMTGVVRVIPTDLALHHYVVTMASKQYCIDAGAQMTIAHECARKRVSSADTCDGFLGGPVIYQIGDVYMLTGIVTSCHLRNAVVITSLQYSNCHLNITE